MAIKAHYFVSLDGVIDAPIWSFEYGFHPKMGERMSAAMATSKAILLGRITYQMFEPAWSTRTVEDDAGAPFFNDTMKYVVSSTLKDATWRNSQILGPYDREAIAALKNEVNGDIFISGSGTLVRQLIQDGLLDELHLSVYPLTRGSGPKLFENGMPETKWKTVVSEGYDNGVTYLTLQRA